MKSLFALAAIGLATLSMAVFDLQKVNRFNSSALVTSSLQRVVPKGDGGFIAAGNANQDIIVVDFDRFGGVLRSGIWDSPLVLNDQLTFLGRYSDGKVLIGVSSTPHIRLIQLSANLTVNWEVQRSMSNPRIALDGSGNAYIGNGIGFEVIGANGLTKGSASLVDFSPTQFAGIPGTTTPGVVIIGRHSTVQQPRAARYSDTGGVIYDRTDTTSVAASGSQYDVVDVESDGAASVGGRVGSSGSTSAMFTSLTAAGVGISSATAVGSDYYKVKIRGSVDTFALINTSGGQRMCRITRSSGMISTISATEPQGFRDFAEITAVGQVVCTTQISTSRYLNATTLAHSSSISGLTGTLSGVSSGVVVGVGTQNDAAEVAFYDGGMDAGLLSYRFAGAPGRGLLGSVSFPDGSVAMLCVEEDAGPSKVVAVRYSAAGNLMYAKTVNFANQGLGMAMPVMIAFPDGSLTCAAQLGNSAWGFARVSNTGVVTSNVYPIFGDYRSPSKLVALPDGSTAVLAVGTDDQLVYTQVSSAGAILQEHQYTDLSGYVESDFAQPVLLNSGNFVVSARMMNGTVKFRAINPATGAAGSILSLGSNCVSVRIDRDGAGNLVTLYDDAGVLKLDRRSGSNLATTLNGATGGVAAKVVEMKIAPNGNVIVLMEQTGDDQVKFFASNFATLATGTLPTEIVEPTDLDVSSANITYVTGREQLGSNRNVYAARYLANGVRSAQRRTAAKSAGFIHVAGSGVWVTGDVGTRKKGVGPFAARYSL